MPFILLAGDCTGSAYIFSPKLQIETPGINQLPVENTSGINQLPVEIRSPTGRDVGNNTCPGYELAFEIECGATVK